jgi:hypothetical protein
MRSPLAAAVIVAAIIAGFLGFTRPGHQLLHNAGFTAACSDGGCGAAIIAATMAAGFLGFTTPGHRLLVKAGFAAACSSEGGCD